MSGKHIAHQSYTEINKTLQSFEASGSLYDRDKASEHLEQVDIEGHIPTGQELPTNVRIHPTFARAEEDTTSKLELGLNPIENARRVAQYILDRITIDA